jgi:hypothetical protein
MRVSPPPSRENRTCRALSRVGLNHVAPEAVGGFGFIL